MLAKTVGYVRLSRQIQVDDSNSLDNHVFKLVSRGLDRDQIFIDIETGTKSSRSGFQEIMQLVKDGKIKKVICSRFDRLTRNIRDWEDTLEEFRSSGVELELLDESDFDIHSVDGRTFSRLKAVFAQLESEMLSLRVTKGWENARRNRRIHSVPFGYTRNSEKHICLDNSKYLCLIDNKKELSKVDIAKDIIQTFISCKTLRKTITTLHSRYGITRFGRGKKPGCAVNGLFEWSSSSLRYWLLNPTIRGHLSYLDGQEIYCNNHPALITDKEFAEVKFILDKNKSLGGWGIKKRRHPLSGHMKCGTCRASLYTITSGKDKSYLYYGCKNRNGGNCKEKRISNTKALNLVFDALSKRAQELANLVSEPDEYVKTEDEIRLETQLKKLEEVNRLGHSEAIEQAILSIEQQLEELRHQQNYSTEGDEELMELLIAAFSDVEYWQSLTQEQLVQIVDRLVGDITIQDGEVIDIKLKV